MWSPDLVYRLCRIKEKPMNRVNLRTVISGLVAAWVFFAVYPVVAGAAEETGSLPDWAVSCVGQVYIADSDPRGTNVRSAPDMSSPVLSVIPNDPESTVVDLSGSFRDWMFIHSARAVTSEFWFKGKGWIHGSLLAVRAVRRSGREVPLYSKPYLGSPLLRTLAGETEARLAGCRGDWMRVVIGRQKGWLAPGDYCGNPVTTCVSVPRKQQNPQGGEIASIGMMNDVGMMNDE
jgi:SH3-like domain-containing protein